MRRARFIPPWRCSTAVVFATIGLLASRTLAGELDLSEVLGRARTASPTVRAAQAGAAAAAGRLAQARLWVANPTVSTALARHTGGGAEYIDREVALSQEVEVGGQRGLRVEAARHDLAHAEALLAEGVRGAEAEARRAFAELVAADRRRAVAAEGVGLAERLAEAARRRARAGDIGTLDVRLAELEVTQVGHQLAIAETGRARAAARLAAAIGAPADETMTARAGEEDDVASVPPADVLVAHALARRPDLAAARAERARLEGEAALVHRQGVVPNPVLRGFYRQEFGDERTAGGEIAVPLPIWNRAQGTETATRASASAAAVEVDRLERDIPRAVRTALAARATAAAAWDRYRRDAEPADRDARELVDRAWTAGYLGLPEVLVQQDRLRAVRAAAIDAWLELRTADADLIDALGGALP